MNEAELQPDDSRLKNMSTSTLQRTFEHAVRKPIRRAGVQDYIERALAKEIERRKAA
jgi:hypothetical protein